MRSESFSPYLQVNPGWYLAGGLVAGFSAVATTSDGFKAPVSWIAALGALLVFGPGMTIGAMGLLWWLRWWRDDREKGIALGLLLFFPGFFLVVAPIGAAVGWFAVIASAGLTITSTPFVWGALSRPEAARFAVEFFSQSRIRLSQLALQLHVFALMLYVGGVGVVIDVAILSSTHLRRRRQLGGTPSRACTSSFARIASAEP